MARALARLLPYVRRSQRAFVFGLVCAILATGISYLSPLVLGDAIDDLAGGGARARLWLDGALILAIAAAEGVCRFLMRKWVIGASRQVEYDLRNDFFAHLERLPLSYFQANRTGDLMSRATNDLNAVRMMVGPALMYLTSTVLGFVMAVTLMLSIDPRLTLLVLVPLPIVSIATLMFGRAIHSRFERIQAQLSDMSAVVQEALAGVRVIRAYGQEASEIAGFRRSNDEYVRRNARLIQLQAAFYPSLTFLFGVSALLMLWLGGRRVIAHQLTLGEFVALNRYLILLSWPMVAFGWVMNLTERGLASWGRMLEVLDATGTTGMTATTGTTGTIGAAGLPAEALGATAGATIEVRHLTFRYPTSTADVLRDVSFRVGAGQTVAIVGPTGAGKSAIVNLLPRLHDPPWGTIFIDGLDIRALPLARVRSLIAMVPQEPFLFSQTIGANIGFALDEAPDAAKARIQAAAHVACLDAEIAGFPDGFETVLGERGITLSGGQKQRTAIARAVAAAAPVLILDDALSAVDTNTEEEMLRRLTSVRRGRTCLMVAHRVSTVHDADLILVLADGRIAESGTHGQLLACGGVYAEMHRRQLLEAELGAAE
jgi:ATP-binding cassette subfamily B protein